MGGAFCSSHSETFSSCVRVYLASVTVRQLIDSWHHQDRLHAAIYPPHNFVLQAGRLSFDMQTLVTTKQQRFFIIPDAVVRFPVHGGYGDHAC